MDRKELRKYIDKTIQSLFGERDDFCESCDKYIDLDMEEITTIVIYILKNLTGKELSEITLEGE